MPHIAFMTQPLKQGLLERILKFLEDNPEITPSTFGLLTIGSGKLVTRLKSGGDITTGSFDKIMKFINEYKPITRT